MNRKIFFSAGLLASLLLIPVVAPRAERVERSHLLHGVANCSPARWVFGEHLRQAPIGLVNEGTGPSFVTCGFNDVSNSLGVDPDEGYSEISVAFLTDLKEPREASCTLVNGILGGFLYSTKTVVVQRFSSPTTIQWSMDADNLGERYWAPVLSCKIPPDVALTYILGNYSEDVDL